MMWYSRETHCYDDCGFAVDGRVVAVLSHSPHQSRVTVLVERAEPTVFSGHGEAVSEGVSYECGAELSSGGTCTRDVDGPDELCWQHDEEDEDEADT